ncbi:ATP-binding cassette domain-containing protein [Gryllotalpicola sp.]|uniref:ABC transporter ATP-binding protein n=1 Tax=Gryllotalpicola sp. TaxID=1932787 RepID=UPI00262E3757|nr:ATP-binding cassette domain-containing protein [Gryllotalpicola sp.]
MPDVVLRLSGVDVIRDERPILAGVDLEVRQGEHWALIGANGAGKSTMLALLAAQQFPSAGTVTVLGMTLGRVELRGLRSRIGHVDPRHRLMNPLTVREVVWTGGTGGAELPMRWSPSDAERERADWLIGVVGLRRLADKPWPTLSQGERGRTLVARALQSDPEILLLDEPTTGLDIPAREGLLDILDQLRAEHPALASVLVTHHLEDLPASTSHAALLREGAITASGAVDRVLTSANLSAALDYPLIVARVGGRWSVRSGRHPNIPETE